MKCSHRRQASSRSSKWGLENWPDCPGAWMTSERDIKEASRATFKTVTSASNQSGEAKADKKNVKIVLKTDVLGSLEALVGSFEKFQHPEVGVEVVARGLGNVRRGYRMNVE